jgi:hypothetical protein
MYSVYHTHTCAVYTVQCILYLVPYIVQETYLFVKALSMPLLNCMVELTQVHIFDDWVGLHEIVF